jgi:murein L,D-transpeptidase YafK
MFRFSLAAVLIGIGVFSPWLVRDWLDWSADERAANRLYEAVSAIPGNVKESVGRKWKGEGNDSTLSDQQSYPVASSTMRRLQGFLPDSLSMTSGSKIPMLSMSSTPPSSSRSRAVVEDASRSLHGELSRIGLSLGDPIFIRLFKEENELEVWIQEKGKPDYSLFKVYRIEDRAGSVGPKLREGDRQAPEGFYYVSAARMVPDTKHFLGMDLGFPNELDRYHNRTGSSMMIHGGDHAAGAFALSRDDMAEVYTLADAALKGGQKFFRVHAFPFRMTDKRMALEWKRQPRWIRFWSNLKEGYDFFENVNYPPRVVVNGAEYEFQLH